jgi:hypothetical protein
VPEGVETGVSFWCDCAGLVSQAQHTRTLPPGFRLRSPRVMPRRGWVGYAEQQVGEGGASNVWSGKGSRSARPATSVIRDALACCRVTSSRPPHRRRFA